MKKFLLKLVIVVALLATWSIVVNLVEFSSLVDWVHGT